MADEYNVMAVHGRHRVYPPATGAGAFEGLAAATGLDAKIQYIAEQVTKGTVKVAKEEVAKLTLPALLIGFATGVLAAKLIWGRKKRSA